MALTTSHLIDVSRKYLGSFMELTSGTKYWPGGILPSEMLCFCSLAWDQQQSEVVESGRKHGFSTEILMKCGFRTVSFEIDPIQETSNRLARLAVENAFDLNMRNEDFTRFAHEVAYVHQCPMLIDGPKGRKAVNITKEAIESLPFAAIHDMSEKAEGGNPNVGRTALNESGLEFVILGDEFAEEFGNLDSGAWKSDYSSRAEMTRYGFHMAIIKGNKWND